MFRPGFINPTPGLKNTYKAYKLFTPFYPLLKYLFPRYVCSLEEIGKAMIHVTLAPDAKRILDSADIRRRAME
jgi:hypothetical protein